MTALRKRNFEFPGWREQLHDRVEQGGERPSGFGAKPADATGNPTVAALNKAIATELAFQFRDFYPSLPHSLASGLERHLIRLCDALSSDGDEVHPSTSSVALANFFAFLKARKIRSVPSVSLRLDGGVSAVWPDRACGPVTFDFQADGNVVYYFIQEIGDRVKFRQNEASGEKLLTINLPVVIGL